VKEIPTSSQTVSSSEPAKFDVFSDQSETPDFDVFALWRLPCATYDHSNS